MLQGIHFTLVSLSLFALLMPHAVKTQILKVYFLQEYTQLRKLSYEDRNINCIVQTCTKLIPLALRSTLGGFQSSNRN